jgi:hypothetical protein
MFQPYSHHQAYLQSLFELYMLNAYAMWDPSSEANIFTGGIKNMNHSVPLAAYVILRDSAYFLLFPLFIIFNSLNGSCF